MRQRQIERRRQGLAQRPLTLDAGLGRQRRGELVVVLAGGRVQQGLGRLHFGRLFFVVGDRRARQDGDVVVVVRLDDATAVTPGSGSDGSGSPISVGARREDAGVADDIGGGVRG